MANASPNFKRCPGNSPACLGVVDYNCCGTVDQDGHASDTDFVIENSKRKKTFSEEFLKKLRFLCRHLLALILLSAKKKLPKHQKDVFQ